MTCAAYNQGYDHAEYGCGKGGDNAHRLFQRENVRYEVAQKEHHERKNINYQCALYNALCRCFDNNMLASPGADGILHNGLHKMLVPALAAFAAVAAAYAEPLNDDLSKSVVTYFSYYCFLKHLYITFTNYTP